MRVSVFVKTRSKENKVEAISKNELAVSVKEKPIDGKANEMVIKILSKYFSVPQSHVTLYKGKKSRIKLFDILL